MSQIPDDAQFLADQQAEQDSRRMKHIISEYLMLSTDKQMQVMQSISNGTFKLDLVVS